MSTEKIDPVFAGALRDRLIRTVRQRRGFTFTKWQLGLGVLAGSTALAGGVAVASTLLSQTPPGAPLDTPLAHTVVASRTGTSTVALGPAPKGTNSISLTLTCRSPGVFEFPDNASESCSTKDLAQPGGSGQRATEVVAVSPGQRSVTIVATPRASWSLRATYIRRVITPFGTNANGQSYGQLNTSGSPDLIQVVLKKDGHQGYAKASDLDCASGGNVKTLAEASAWTAFAKTHNVSIPVYESNGTTVIGSMSTGTPSGPGITTVPVSSLYAQCRRSSQMPSPTSSGTVKVPNIVGMTDVEAGNALAKLHLDMAVGFTQVASPSERVVSQYPSAGARVQRGTGVAVRFETS